MAEQGLSHHPEFRVNFLIAGAAKCGTTALAKFLCQHPDVFIPLCKEVRYFNHDHYFKGSGPKYDEYHRLFDDNSRSFIGVKDVYASSASPAACHERAGLPKAIGDATPMYMWWEPAAERICKYNPAMKLIFILRNPMERAYSHHNMLVGKKTERLSFSVAIRIEGLRTLLRGQQLRGKAYVGRSMYGMQIKKMMKHFPREQMLFLKNEDLRKHHDETMRRVHAFLDIPHVEIPQEEVFSSGARNKISASDRKWLWKRFEKDVQELEQLTGLDCSSWKP